MLKCEIKDGYATIALSADDEVEAFAEFLLAVELVAHRLYINGVDKKSIMKLLKIATKEVKQEFPKLINNFCTKIDEKRVNKNEMDI